MTAAPNPLPETPASTPSFDVLSDVLRVVRMSGAVFFRADMAGAWAARSVPGSELARTLFPTARQLLLFHVMESGRTWVALDDDEPISCGAGDIVVLPYGDEHTLATDLTLRPMPMRMIIEQAMAPGGGVHQIVGGRGDEHVCASSAAFCTATSFSSIRSAVACRPLIHVRAAKNPRARCSLR